MGAMLLFVPLSLAAGAIPQWAWPPEPLRYHLETLLVTPRGHLYLATENHEEQAAAVRVRADAECTGLLENVWSIRCTFHYLDIDGDALRPDERSEAQLDSILDEWTATLRGVTVVMRQGTDGELRQFDIEGVQTRDRRSELVLQTQRMLLQRVFCVFDAPLGQSEDDFRRGWNQHSAGELLRLQGLTGTVGSARLTVRPIRADDGGYTLSLSGRAMLAQGAGLDQGAVQMRQEVTPPSRSMSVDTTVDGTMIWEVGAPAPVWRDVHIEGRHTASSSEFGNPIHMQQLSGMQLVAAFGVDGAPPEALSALRAPRVDHEPAATELPLVPFVELGMMALSLPKMPDAGRALSLPGSNVRARVTISAEGRVDAVEVYAGYAVLEPAIVGGLRALQFPVREEKPYAVDVEVWVGG